VYRSREELPPGTRCNAVGSGHRLCQFRIAQVWLRCHGDSSGDGVTAEATATGAPRATGHLA